MISSSAGVKAGSTGGQRRQETAQTSSGTGQGSKGSKDQVKTKSIAFALERMSQMFRGTMKVKATERGGASGGGGATIGSPLTLEELDRPSHCPEGVEDHWWLHLVKIGRAKIDSEKAIARLESDIAGLISLTLS